MLDAKSGMHLVNELYCDERGLCVPSVVKCFSMEVLVRKCAEARAAELSGNANDGGPA